MTSKYFFFVLLFNNIKDKFVLLVKNIFQILCCSEHVTELIECCCQSCCFKTMTLEGHFDGKWPFDDISIKMPITEQHKIKKVISFRNISIISLLYFVLLLKKVF
jgi:hypothetical protein